MQYKYKFFPFFNTQGSNSSVVASPANSDLALRVVVRIPSRSKKYFIRIVSVFFGRDNRTDKNFRQFLLFVTDAKACSPHKSKLPCVFLSFLNIFGANIVIKIHFFRIFQDKIWIVSGFFETKSGFDLKIGWLPKSGATPKKVRKSSFFGNQP